MISYPGQRPQAAGGRLVNCYPEPLPPTGGKPNVYWRVPGLSQWGTAPSGAYRGGIVVAGTFYGLFGTTVYKWTSAGGAGTALPGTITGTQFCAFAANQNTPPDIAVVSPGVGAFVVVDPTGVASYPDVNVGSPNWVIYHQGFFLFSAGSGKVISSNVNLTSINPINFVTAQSKPDALYRPIQMANGQLLFAGSSTMEVWGPPINSTGFPYSYIATIYRGIPGPQAICGNEDGWGKGIFFVGDDNRVSTLTAYMPTPISINDIDVLIEAEPDKTKIIVGCYVSRGHGFVVVQGPNWCWEYDTTLQSWHERQSYLQTYWRAYQPINVFGSWLAGDILGSNLLKIDGTVRKELTNPLRMRLETGLLGAFPKMVRVNGIELYMTKGASIATGHDPDETNAQIEISMSRDGGQTWTNPRQVPLGQQSVTTRRARAFIWGQAEIQGVRWRFDESAGLNFGFMGADMQSETLKSSWPA